MKTRFLLACETIKDEVELIKEKWSIDIETIWMSNTLHTYPEKLRDALQEEIDKLKEVDELLFAYGNCGNGLVGLESDSATMIIPKYGDCIDIFLNKQKNLERIRTNTYFLTRGWLDGKQGLEWEIKYNIERFGEKRAKRISEMLYKHYNYLMLIDTGAYNVKEFLPRVEKIAETLNMEPIVYQGDITPIEKLLNGQWDEDFCIIEPGRKTTYSDFDGSNLRFPC
ncbi:MAG: DUF1638 domain-containing protein [Eubacterium sp.]